MNLEKIHQLTTEETMYYFIELEIIVKQAKCEECLRELILVKTKRNIDEFSWRCHNNNCKKVGVYLSIRKYSKLEYFKIALKKKFIDNIG
jgi:hypothetical protein